MARKLSPIEVQNFSQGLVTEVNPLSFPPNASVDELNFEIRPNQTRRRRLGMALEPNAAAILSGYSFPTALQSFIWSNVGGDPSRKFVCVQVGNRVLFFDVEATPISSGYIGNIYVTDYLGNPRRVGYAVVDGILVLVSGARTFKIVEYKNGAITQKNETLKIRDLFGVQVSIGGETDSANGTALVARSVDVPSEYIYNLQNQSFGVRRPRWDDNPSTLGDPIVEFRAKSGYLFPSNADAVYYALYPKADAVDPEVERFHAENLVKNPPGTTPASRGFFIIDALNRGFSRNEESAKNSSSNNTIFVGSTSKQDITLQGPTCTGEFAGRAWFAGFGGEVLDGDARSPQMSSYLLFSKLVENPGDLRVCYQIGDPTSKEESELLATDGGFIRIGGAFNINKLVAIGSGLIIFAENGIWRLRGGDSGFSATDYMVEKLSEKGCFSPTSAVEVDGGVFFWGSDGIYVVAPDQFGDYKVTSISSGTIQRFFGDIPPQDKQESTGQYDSFDGKIRWIYGMGSSSSHTNELVLDVKAGAFYPVRYYTTSSGYPRIVSSFKAPPYKAGVVKESVSAVGVQVVVGLNEVEVSTGNLEEGFRELSYVALLPQLVPLGQIRFSFASLSDSSFKDWKDYDGVGVDAPAHMVTGYLTGGDTQRDKGVASLTMHFERTEDGFQADGQGDLYPTNASSCLVQSQWNWADSASSGKWGREFQMYRYRRLYMPSGAEDDYNNGHSILTSYSRLRGKGKAISLLIKTEPEKDCRVLGWAMSIGVEQNA